ncbi:TetR/AcrR family transcriptional regulator [Natranaerobius thermophilus]|uniref:Transcriptional regulator, TetR family n=1 Tax=Natranaerobius thermophilus (strain ATCC BAA-1301 / DSM 18059 / JW/NM-WN-LF) TaxID=457570 RepID=B2A1T6_NATTJ|nr:TetR/AcrR family transcriptional regulator [Natranaerobius thermophilus]ACB86133.1 transcriptional regulator, TetR family [Natranaerobius thermophilus JW/NM-WN-LF]
MRYTSRELKAKKNKKKIFVTAIDLIRKKGYDNVSINEICSLSGFTKGAFYHYFNSKEDLLIQLLRDVDDYYTVEVLPKLDGMSSTEKLTYFMQQFAYCGYGVGVDIINNLFKSQTKVLNDFMNDYDRPFFKILLEIIDEGQKKGEFTDKLSCKELAQYCMSFTWGVLHNWTLENGEYDIEEKMKSYLKVFILSILY